MALPPRVPRLEAPHPGRGWRAEYVEETALGYDTVLGELSGAAGQCVRQALPSRRRSREFWTPARHSCASALPDCDRFYFYPAALPHAGCRPERAVGTSRRAQRTPTDLASRLRGFADDVPYVIAVVELDEGPRMMTNLVEVEPMPEALPVDMPLEIVYDAVTDEVTLAKFRPARG